MAPRYTAGYNTQQQPQQTDPVGLPMLDISNAQEQTAYRHPNELSISSSASNYFSYEEGPISSREDAQAALDEANNEISHYEATLFPIMMRSKMKAVERLQELDNRRCVTMPDHGYNTK